MGDAELRVSSSVPNLPRISANGLDEPESALAGRTTIYTRYRARRKYTILVTTADPRVLDRISIWL